MPYKFIYFDLDDTLLDHRAAEKAGLSDVHTHFSFFETIDLDVLVDTYHAVNSVQWKQYSRGEVTRNQLQRNRFEQTLQRLNLDTGRYKEVGRYYVTCYCKHWQWIPGAKEGYEHIAESYPVGILTNGFAETQRKKFDAFGLNSTADYTVISEEVGALKPDPKVFEYATELTGYAKNDILYVGDSFSSDVQGGTGFGWDTAWYTQNGETEKRRKADFVFSNFEDLVKLLNVQG